MAYHKSAEKRIRSTETKRVSNRYQARTVRNAVKTLKNTEDKEEAAKKLPKVVSQVDKLAKKGVIHKNKAANLKSKLMKRITALKAEANAAPKAEKEK
jgi:small subunit ribosomal protein S20